MSFFDPTVPILRCKQEALDVQDLEGLLCIDLRLGALSLFSSFYTRIDQVFVVWGWITLAIFSIAQFFPLSWQIQAIFWSVLTLVGCATTIWLTWFWVSVERLRWVAYLWVGLMLLGVSVTDYGVFCGCGNILLNLCPLWLGISAVGYAATGLGMRSRTFLLASIIHVLGIMALPYFPGWQFLATGSIMAGSLLLLAELQWDMRSPQAESALLSEEQRQFNRQQQELRLMESPCRI